MYDNMRIDSHKLMFHPIEVAKWLTGRDIFPLYMEISPTGSCNHRCVFCALDYLEYSPKFLDATLLLTRLTEMGMLGVKSIMYGGEGEPLLHRHITEIINHTKKCGIDVALTTNGTLFTREVSEQTIKSLSWVKLSINAGTAATYSALHRTNEEDFNRVFRNLAEASETIARLDANCTLGVQAILLPENASEMEELATKARAAGASYLVIKAYSQHQHSLTRRYAELDYAKLIDAASRLADLSDDNFQVVFRANSIDKLQRGERGYERCLALPFWSYIDSGGTVWGCSAHLSDDRFNYGSIVNDTFKDIWQGEKRHTSLDFVAHHLNTAECRFNCRMDEINRYLLELTHPHEHINFI